MISGMANGKMRTNTKVLWWIVVGEIWEEHELWSWASQQLTELLCGEVRCNITGEVYCDDEEGFTRPEG